MKTYLKNLIEELSGPRSKRDESFSLAIVSVLRMVLEDTRFQVKGVHATKRGIDAIVHEKDSPYSYEINVIAIKKPHWTEFNLNEQVKRCKYCGTDHYEPEDKCGSLDFSAAWILDNCLFTEDEIDWSGYEKQT